MPRLCTPRSAAFDDAFNLNSGTKGITCDNAQLAAAAEGLPLRAVTALSDSIAGHFYLQRLSLRGALRSGACVLQLERATGLRCWP